MKEKLPTTWKSYCVTCHPERGDEVDEVAAEMMELINDEKSE
jgi:hypothetical protein